MEQPRRPGSLEFRLQERRGAVKGSRRRPELEEATDMKSGGGGGGLGSAGFTPEASTRLADVCTSVGGGLRCAVVAGVQGRNVQKAVVA